MRTAIVLLFLLALAAIPGSLLPQRSLSPTGVASYYRDHPTLAPLLDRLGMFAVFASPWFAAVYLLLFTSLVGCLIPRCLEHARSLKAGPPPVPRHLHRLPAHLTWRTDTTVDDAADAAEQRLRHKRFRVNRRQAPESVELAAERGRLKETGNLVFHISLLVLLLAVAGGKLWGYEGNILVTEGDGFCNSFQQYDQYRAGPLVKQQNLSPLCFDLEDFNASYELNGTPASFTADIAVQDRPGAAKRTTRIGVNDPLRLEGDRLYVTGHGFSPTFTITLPNGQTFGPLSAPFLPQDSRTFGSQGVVKLPDLGDGSGDGFALAGFFAPTGMVADGVLRSVDARPLSPQVAIIAYRGYLGLDSGAPQSVFQLDQRQIDVGALSKIGAVNLTIGQSATLDDGTSVRFDGFREFAALQVSHDPAQVAVLGSAIMLLAGLVANLLLRRERVFIRLSSAESDAGNRTATVGTAAGLSRGGGDDAQARLDDLLGGLAVEAGIHRDHQAEPPVSAS
ncbi:cytochrome c biogenesis protein ResB [Modestobacter altitudinis]|uniref:cytochrome c biogenesis protein ResB n=1 Tax=Modestobacter altitudinis TaxID=2213158 RepID=UPI00110D1C63|nr:cytochrome c biogenesis protein ResB [Modestobacter altitudinis]